MLHVCCKVSDRVDSKVDSKDDEVKQENYTWQASYASSHNACMVAECIRLIDFLTPNSHGAAVCRSLKD
jgi:hypothetical protein